MPHTRRAMAATTPRHTGHPFASVSNSWVRCLTGCGAGPQSFVSTSKAMPCLSSTYRLKWCPVSRLSARGIKKHWFNLLECSLEISSQVKIWVSAFWAFFISWYQSNYTLLFKGNKKPRNSLSCFRIWGGRKESTGLIFSFLCLQVPIKIIRPKYFILSLQSCALDLETSWPLCAEYGCLD